MNFRKENEEITRAVLRLFDMATTYRPGDMLHWSAIESCIGVTRNENRFWQIVKKFRARTLKERCIAMRPEYNVGLVFLTPKEQVYRCAEDRHRKMFRQSTRAMKELTHVNEHTLSDHDRRMRFSQIDHLRKERKAIRASVKEVSKSEALPRRKVPGFTQEAAA